MMKAIRYRISAEDKILEVNAAWDEFALDNGAQELISARVVMQPLWRFIADLETRYLYQIIFKRIRATRQPLRFPFRCDAPALRRFMELEMSQLPGGEIQFDSRLVRTESRDPVLFIASGGVRNQHVLKICSWCKRVQLPANEWVDAEEAIRRKNLFDHDTMPIVTHGVCSSCHGMIRQSMSGST